MLTTNGSDAGAGPLIELAGLGKSYVEGGRRRVVLRDATAVVGAGEIVVLLGRSGSGKSTLLNLIAGIDRPDAGRVVVAGHDLGALDETALARFRRRHVGFVFQDHNLLPALTVLENVLLRVELADRLQRLERGGAAGRARALELLAAVGLADRAGSHPDLLSGGERQRVAVACGLVHGPALVLADEPTGNLDLENGRQVLALLDDLTRRTGRTLVMATHSPEVMGAADRLWTIRDGRLDASPPTAGP